MIDKIWEEKMISKFDDHKKNSNTVYMKQVFDGERLKIFALEWLFSILPHL